MLEVENQGVVITEGRVVLPVGPECWWCRMHRESETNRVYARVIPVERYPISPTSPTPRSVKGSASGIGIGERFIRRI